MIVFQPFRDKQHPDAFQNLEQELASEDFSWGLLEQSQNPRLLMGERRIRRSGGGDISANLDAYFNDHEAAKSPPPKSSPVKGEDLRDP